MFSATLLRVSAALAIVLACTLSGCARPGADVNDNGLEIKGSDTMVHLVSKWAELYMTQHPDAGIAVTGGGSGTGISAMLNGTTDLCMASREVKPDERALAEEKGFAFIEYVVARDGLAIIVHPSNPVEYLSMAQLKGIFTGAITNWSEVGGADAAIGVATRDSSSGTYVFFQEFVLEKENYSPDARPLTSNAGILQTVKDEATAIGYVGLGYAENAGDAVKVLPVGDSADAIVMPSVASVQQGNYPIARPLYIYSSAQPSALAQSFMDFCVTETGQAVVQEAGYVPVPAS